MRIPVQADLRPTFDQLATSTYNRVPGVIRLVVGTPTRKVVLAAMTHGNEPSGLGAFRFLLDNVDRLRDVELILAIHNIDAGARWFAATTSQEKHRCRAHGWNFNRLPPEFPESPGGPSALDRIRRLWRDVYPDTTHALDMHSADQSLCANGLSLDIAGDPAELERVSDALPATARFRGITPLQLREGSCTKPVGTIFGGPKKEAVALEIESDSHESPIGIGIAVQTVVAMLTALDCLVVDEIIGRSALQDVFDVKAAVMVPGPGYRFVSPDLLKSFAPIQLGQRLLTGPQGDVYARFTGRLIFTPSTLELKLGDETEEACFELSEGKRQSRQVRLPKWFVE